MAKTIRKRITVLLIMSLLLQLFVGVAPVMANLKAEESEFVPQLAVTLSPGEVAGTTSVTVTDHVYSSLVVNVTDEEITTPYLGDIAPSAGANLIADYESGADITAGVAAGNYLQIYDVDMEEAGIAAFYQVQLTEADIKEMDIEEEPPEDPVEEAVEKPIEEPVEDPVEEPAEVIEEDVKEDVEKEKPAGGLRMFSMAPMSSGTTLETYTLGENVTGTLYDDGELVIEGTGPMNNYTSTGSTPLASNKGSIISVVINSGVTTIGDYVFGDCTLLESITIPDSVTSIGGGAFYNCEFLTDITIPDSVTSIANWAFYNCLALTSFTVDGANTAYSSLNGVLFNKDQTTLLYYPIGNTQTSYTVPNSVIMLGRYAFSGCSTLASVTIPNSVTSIDYSVFNRCSSLASVTIPSSVESINANAFTVCTALTSITNLYDGNQNVHSTAFNTGATGLRTAAAYSANTNFINMAMGQGYDIEYLDPIVITADDGTWAYDGQPHSKATFTTTGLPAGYTIEAVISGSITNLGTIDNVVESYVIKSGEEDVTAKFTDVSTAKGTLTVTAKPLEIKAKDASKTYDGTELSNNGWDLTSGTLVAGDSLEVTAAGSITNVGTAANAVDEVRVMHDGTTDVTENYNITTQNGTLEVTARTLEITAASASRPYDGTALTNTGYTTTAGSLAAGQTMDSATVTGSQLYPGSSANTSSGAVIKDTGGTDVTANYAITYVNGTLTVTPAEIAITVTANSDSKEYDGTPLIKSGGVLTSGTLAAGDSLEVTAAGSITNVGTAANAVDEVRVMHDGTTDVTENYNITTQNGTLEVTARTLEITAVSASRPYDGTALTNTGYTTTAGSLAAGQTLDSATVTGSQLYPGSSANTASGAVIKDTGGTDVTANYDITYAAGTLTVTRAAIAITVTANSDSRVYDGTPLTNNGGVLTSGTLATGDTLEVTATGSITDVGTAANTVTDVIVKHDDTTDVTENYNITKAAGTLEVTARTLEITAASASRPYDGTALTNTGYTTTAGSLAAGQTMDSATVTGSQLYPGSSANTASGAVIKDTGGTDVTANYDITYAAGTLTVTRAAIAITVTANSDSRVYDGTPLTNNGGVLTSGTLATGDTLEVTATGSRTDVGTAANTVTDVIVKHDDTTDVTENYNITKAVGTLEVTARPLEITAASNTKTYNGTPLTNTGYSITAGSLAADQTLDSVTVTGTQLFPGSSANTASGAVIKDTGGATVTANYDITYAAGTLTVTKAAIALTVTANSDSRGYDGTPLTNNGGVLTSGTLATGDSLEVTATGSKTDAGTAANAVTDVRVKHGTTDVTENYNITTQNGTLEVTARPLQITAASDTKTYNGTSLTNTGYSITAGSLAAAQTLDSVTVTGTQLFPGSSANTASGAVITDTGGADATANYDITYAAGTLTVTRAAIAITVTANSDSRGYDGTPLTNNGGVLTSGTLATGDSLEVTATGSKTDAGTAANAVTDVRVKHGTTDVTENYNITTQNGTLEVTARTLEITAASASRPYDGTALTNTGYTITAGSLAADQTLDSVTVTGTQLYLGSSTNTASGAVIKGAGGTDVTANYALTYVNGSLEVTAANIAITVTAKSDSKKYDGTELTNNGWDLTSGTLAAEDTLEVTVVGSITDVGTAENKITLIKVMNGTIDVTGNYDITCVDGTLVINRRSRSREETTTSQPAPSQENINVIVNGEVHDAVKETKTTEDERSTVIIEVNNQAIESIINEAIENNPSGIGNAIQVPVADTNSEVAKVELTGDIVKKLEENTFDVSVKRDDVEYVIPAEEFTISQVAENLGVSEKDLKDIKVEVKITKLDETVVAKYNEVVKASGAELVFPPVEFAIAAKTTRSDGTTGEAEISKFSIYVDRVMEIPAGVDPSKITTGVVFNPDGTYSHVPTTIYQHDGKWYAKLSSLTNSTYSVIWNPITVKSVENHWAKDTVNDLAARLVVFNPETFEPNKAITRADFAEYIVRALGLYRGGSKYENKFTDVQNSGARTLAILIANEYGLVSGYPDGTFKPERQITREEAMAMYQRAMGFTKLTGNDKDRFLNYTDFDQVSSWAEAAVKETLSAHIFNGTSATIISPKSNLTYAETAQAIKNLLVGSKLIDQ